MPASLQGRRIAFLATDGVEQSELTEPWKALREAGAETDLISLESGRIQGFEHQTEAASFAVDRTIDEVDPSEYDGLVVPGGVANPDRLRMDERAVRFVAEFVASDKPVGVICHGPWMLVEADVVRGRTLTSWPSLKTDIRNAGGDWVDQEVVVDRSLVTSRKPRDLPLFCTKLIEEIAALASRNSQSRELGV
jgi:protease I